MLHTAAKVFMPMDLRTIPMAMPESSRDQLPPQALAIFLATIFLFVLIVGSVRYTLSIVTTLAMVESPRTSYLVSEEKALDGKDPEVFAIEERTVTPNIRRTVRHLVSRGGSLARWRGAAVITTYSVAYTLISQPFTTYGLHHSHLLMLAVGVHVATGIVTELMLALLSATWTHVVISEPSSKTWLSRVPPLRTWKKLALPTAVRSLCLQMTGYLPFILLFQVIRSTDFQDKNWPREMGVLYFGVFVVGLMTFFGLYIPSEVTLTRVQASLLPDDVETIVNVDRTFGGRVVPEIVGGSGCVGFLGAWKSFDGPARVRLLKLFAKIVMIEIVMHAAFAIVLGLEILMVAKPDAVGAQLQQWSR